MPYGVGQNGLEPLPLGTRHVCLLVGDEPHETLRLALRHEPRLVMVDAKTFF